MKSLFYGNTYLNTTQFFSLWNYNQEKQFTQSKKKFNIQKSGKLWDVTA
jgi:hypothetical protein